MPLRRFFSVRRDAPCGVEGWRAYVVGDVHGCLDALDALLAQIVADHEARVPARALLVFLGDLIDRGPASAQVVERVRTLALPGVKVVTLAGNHEEVLLKILDGEQSRIEGWLKFGGAETLASYGVDPGQVAALPPGPAQEMIAAAIPSADRQFLQSLGDTFRFGDYLFVHAGLRPGLPLSEQSAKDLRWIREPFLSDPRDHGVTVVHGHTITETVDERANRIGIDTGAYRTGRLTALAIEGEERWFLATEPASLPLEKQFV